MKVGDLVKAINGDMGIITVVGRTQICCIWQDGDVSWCLKRVVEVTNENR